jgi:predicted unusual protein kinase regulating ubiquinone biosynthesis (AarF/ABC1/UbiB family)
VTLDEEFDFIDVATDYLRDQGFLADTAQEYVEDRVDEVQEATKSAVRTPPKVEELLDQATNEDLQVQVDFRDSQNLLGRVTRRLIYGMVLASSVFSAAVLLAFEQTIAAGATVGFAVLVAGLLYYSFRKRRGIRAQPQFTRQNMRERDRER